MILCRERSSGSPAGRNEEGHAAEAGTMFMVEGLDEMRRGDLATSKQSLNRAIERFEVCTPPRALARLGPYAHASADS